MFASRNGSNSAAATFPGFEHFFPVSYVNQSTNVFILVLALAFDESYGPRLVH